MRISDWSSDVCSSDLAVLLAAAFALLTPALLTPAQAKVFDPVSFTLDNGLQVVVVVNRRAPIVHHSVWYRVGAADEQAGESGLAHFLEHLMFKGTETLDRKSTRLNSSH